MQALPGAVFQFARVIGIVSCAGTVGSVLNSRPGGGVVEDSLWCAGKREQEGMNTLWPIYNIEPTPLTTTVSSTRERSEDVVDVVNDRVRGGRQRGDHPSMLR